MKTVNRKKTTIAEKISNKKKSFFNFVLFEGTKRGNWNGKRRYSF